MIEVKERLNVSAKDFFSKIEESVVYDIEKSTGKNQFQGIYTMDLNIQRILKINSVEGERLTLL